MVVVLMAVEVALPELVAATSTRRPLLGQTLLSPGSWRRQLGWKWPQRLQWGPPGDQNCLPGAGGTRRRHSAAARLHLHRQPHRQ